MKDHVYSAGYRRIAERAPRVHPARPIARTMLTLAWRKRSTKFLLLLCLGVFLGHGAWMVFQLLVSRAQSMTQAVAPGMAEAMFGSAREVIASYLTTQFYVTAFAIAGIAGGCVAEDRRVGAFDLVFARPLSTLDYALGKLLGAGLVPVATLVLPALLLWLIAVGIAPTALRTELWWLIIPTVAGASLAALFLTTCLVGLSAHCARASTVTVLFVAALVVGSGIVEGVATSGLEFVGYLGPERDLRTVIDWLCAPQKSFTGGVVNLRGGLFNDSPLFSAVAVFGYIAAGLLALRLRLRWEVVQ